MTDLEQRLRDALHEDAQRARLVNPDAPPVPEARLVSDGQRQRRPSRRLVAIAAAIALIVAAGVAVVQDDDRGPRVTSGIADPEDQAIADGAVLTPDDMPPGWEAAPSDVEARWQHEGDAVDEALADCLGIDAADVQHDHPTAASAFVNSYEENDERVVSEVTAFPSAADAQEVTDRFRTSAAQGCYLAGIEQQVAAGARDGVTMTFTGQTLAGADVEIGESTIKELYWEYQEDGYWKTITDDSIALRVTVPLVVDGVDVDVHVDTAFIRKGRFLVQTSFQTYFLGFDGGSTSTSVAPGSAVRLTKQVFARLPGVTAPNPVDTVDPALGQPGPLGQAGEQPADAVAAEEEVRAAFTGIFDASQPRQARAQLSERPATWSAANQQLVEGEYGAMVEDLHAVVDEVVFTSPTRAAVRFDLITPAGYSSADQVGHAVLVDGRWLVAIATTCDQVSIAGVECDMSL